MSSDPSNRNIFSLHVFPDEAENIINEEQIESSNCIEERNSLEPSDTSSERQSCEASASESESRTPEATTILPCTAQTDSFAC
jgi:hypothetical protein